MSQLEQHLIDQDNHAEKGKNFFWHRIRSLVVFELLKKYITRKNPKLLDFGAGAGVFFDHLATSDMRLEYHFKEQLPSLVKMLEEKAGSRANKNAEENFKDMDAVILLDVLEHQENDVAFMSDLKKKLGPDSVVVTCPAMMFLWSKWDEALGHYKRYTKKTMKESLEASGFQVLECQYVFNAMVLPGLVRKMGLLKSESEFPDVSAGVNKLAYLYCYFERLLFKFLPFGSSIVAVAKPKS